MTFQAAALAAFATASSTALNAGYLDLLDNANGVLASVTLNTPAGTAAGAVTTFAGFPKTATALPGAVASARLRTSSGSVYKVGIPVGVPGSGAQVIVNNGIATLVLMDGQTIEVAVSPTLTHVG